jgi:tight adherence protein B
MMPIIVAVLAFLSIGAAAWAFVGGENDNASRRAKEIGAPRKNAVRRDMTAEVAAQKRKQSNSDALKDLNEKQKKTRKSMLSIKGKIAQAGLSVPVLHFWIAAGVLGVAGFGACMYFGAPIYMAALAAFIGFVGVPRWVLGFLISRRQKKFGHQLADGIDVIVRGVKSGLPLNQCLRILATESPEPLKSEFSSVCDAQQMGVPLEQNLQKLYEHMPLPEVNFFNIVLIIQAKAGGNLSEALGNLSTVLRARRLLGEKIKALSSEAKASAGIIGSLPIAVMILVYLTRPDYIMILFNTNPGHIVLLGAATSMFTGIMVMRKMINFKY